MKKYVKPELFFESFELSQQIAACDLDSNNTANDEGCMFTGIIKEWPELGEVTVFMAHCGDAGHYDLSDWGYCYHNSISSPLGIFNS